MSSCCDSGGNQHVKVTSPNFQASTGYFIESVSFSGGASASGNHPPSTWGVSRIRINNGAGKNSLVSQLFLKERILCGWNSKRWAMECLCEFG